MMSDQILVLDAAARDLEQGIEFYESQMAGLGSYFSDSILSDLEALKISAGVHAVVFGLHRALSRRFPFTIYYSYDGSLAKVIAILDMRRNPAWTHEELSQRNRD